MKNKKLLILGANYETIPLIEKAKEMGVITYVTDYNPEAPAKKIADKPYNVDCMDLDALEDLCRRENIDGVLLGVADSLVKIYPQLCERLGYPSYATRKQSEILSNKKLFDEYCKKFNIPTIPNFKVDLDNFEETTKDIRYPVFVKPVDGNSGKGISICYNISQLTNALVKAKKASRSGCVLIEKYMECDNLLLYFTFMNGEYFLTAIGDKFTIKQKDEGSMVCVGLVYPSRYIDMYKENLQENLYKLFDELEIKNGVLQISAFVENGTIHLYDPGFRLQGEASNTHIEKATGFDQREILVNIALGNPPVNTEKISDKIGTVFSTDNIYVSIWILLKEGLISEIKGMDSLKNNPSVHTIHQRMFKGDKVDSKMIATERQVFARLYCRFNRSDDLVYQAKSIEDSIEILDEFGSSMKLPSLSSKYY